jgi:hypothetical protein
VPSMTWTIAVRKRSRSRPGCTERAMTRTPAAPRRRTTRRNFNGRSSERTLGPDADPAAGRPRERGLDQISLIQPSPLSPRATRPPPGGDAFVLLRQQEALFRPPTQLLA